MRNKTLFVEDDRDIQSIAVNILTRAHHDVLAASSAEEAIKLIAEHKFSLAITDFDLGCKLSGVDVVQALRRDQPGTPIIVITGRVADLPAWILRGPLSVRVISKPFSFLSLLDAIKCEFDRLPSPDSGEAEEARWSAATLLPKEIEASVHQLVNQESIVAITNRHGSIVYANDRFCEISGYSRPELLGQNHRILKSGKHPPGFYKQIWTTILSGRSWRGEICNRAKDGHFYYVDTVIAPLRKNGLTTHFISVRTDITARKLAEASLDAQEKCEEDEHRMSALGRMADGLLHDLNNILTGIVGIADAELGSRSGPLQDAVNRMLHLTRTLRDYTTGRPAKEAPFRLNPLLSCACSLVRYRKNTPANLKILEQLKSTADIEIVGNEGQIFEIVLNLLINAVEATTDSFTPEIRVRAHIKNELAVVTVEDNGPGVPEEIRPTIFEPYSSTKGRGRGIGLSISRQIALAHGGELRLQPHDSVKGGAGFCLEIPARPIVPDRVAAEVLPPGPRRFVLVSEDDVDVRRLIERTVREIGLAVLWHTSGAEIPASTVEARDTLAAAVIDSCALDLESATVASLRQLSPSLPILLVSASLIDRGRRITRWGMVESLPKPFDSLEFAEALYSALADESLVRWTNAQSDSQPCFHMETQE